MTGNILATIYAFNDIKNKEALDRKLSNHCGWIEPTENSCTVMRMPLISAYKNATVNIQIIICGSVFNTIR